MARMTLRAKGQLTLPDDVRKAAKLQEGDLIEAEVTENGEVILRPLATVDRSQAWFWTPEWQAGEREATEQGRRDEGELFENGSDFLDSLRCLQASESAAVALTCAAARPYVTPGTPEPQDPGLAKACTYRIGLPSWSIPSNRSVSRSGTVTSDRARV